MRDLRKFFGAALLALVAILLTFQFKAALGWSPDFLVPVLAVLGFTLDIYPLALITLLAVWIIDWQTALPPELWLVAATPFAVWMGRKFLPSVAWLTLAGIIAAVEIALYALAAGPVFEQNLGFIASNVAFAVFLGLALMRMMEWIYEKR